ncbi:MAG: ABC transporter ATP-binding protein [Clostridia bacterium]|nr:ABC transporter ATP-binding protein [Clostridia bacterium]
MEKEKLIDLKRKKVSTKNLRKVLPLYFKHKKLILPTMLFILISGVLGIMQPIFSANALAALADANFELAIKNMIIMVAFSLGRMLFNALDEYFYVKIVLKIRYELTDQVVCAINRTQMKQLDGTSLGSLADRLSSDVMKVSDVYLDLINLFFNILTNIVFLVYIAYLNIYMFLIIFAYVIILYIICTISSRLWIRGRKIVKSANDEARTSYFEQITGIRDAKLLNISNELTSFSNSKHKRAIEIEEKVALKRNLMRRCQTLVTAIFELSFLLAGVAFVKADAITIAGLLIIYMYQGRVGGIVSYLSTIKEYKADGEIAATRIYEIIEDYDKESFGTNEIKNFSGKIEFSHVNFGYFDAPVLKDLSMKFEPGKITAIVGKSGSGKTTILSLISKLYNTSSGEILFDENEIKTLTESSIRGNVGEVSQMPYIFNASVRQNLLFVKPEASEREIIKVLKQAQIYDDVKKMPNGLDTEIGENGVKLSGGQRQRIAIARLLLKNSKVIVFDEATSALDNTRQNEIVDLLDKLKENKTIIIVAHRLSTIVGSDQIYMLEDGKVIASGNHTFLMQNSKEYSELYKLEEESAKIN